MCCTDHPGAGSSWRERGGAVASHLSAPTSFLRVALWMSPGMRRRFETPGRSQACDELRHGRCGTSAAVFLAVSVAPTIENRRRDVAVTTDEILELAVECDSGGQLHSHVLKIAQAPLQGFAGVPMRPGAPGKRSVQYQCPISGEDRLARFLPPPGFEWPFSVLSLS
jgi:hypothetical protein